MKILVLAFFATVLTSSPSFAKKIGGEGGILRYAAVRDCSTRAQRYTEYTWGNMEFQQYRACMAERRQPE